ncbi:MAG: ABC transporter ATP-binding protein [Ilumatobacteraceae bacterium]
MSVTFQPGQRGDAPSRAVRDATFAVHAGRIVGLVGESGSGKTATALALLGLHDLDVVEIGGSATFDGDELLHRREEEMRRVRGARIGMVFQEPMTALNPLLPIGRQVDEVLRAHTDLGRAEVRQRVLEVLGEVGIPNPPQRARAYPHQLSGGLGQRAMIASAIACHPRLLIADEPTTALDVTLQAQILRLLRELVEREEMAVLLVTHDLAVVAESCDDVVVMYAGEVVETGTTAEVIGDPRHPYTRRLLAARPRAGGWGHRLTPIPGRVPSATAERQGCAFRNRCDAAGPGCELPQALDDLAGGRRVRCCRARDPLASAS